MIRMSPGSTNNFFPTDPPHDPLRLRAVLTGFTVMMCGFHGWCGRGGVGGENLVRESDSRDLPVRKPGEHVLIRMPCLLNLYVILHR
jgi:hypothetical protein